MKLRPHQARIVKQNPRKALLVHEMRTGKSLIAKLWSEHPDRNDNAVVVCMKSNKKDWVELCPHATVYTKEEFKRDWQEIERPTCIVVDECHNFASPLFIAKLRSQLAEALYYFIKNNPEMDILLLTATPLTNNPASLHTLLSYLGKNIDWKEYRDRYYTLERRPYLPHPAWLPKAGWRIRANKTLEKYADIVSLKDCVDSLPPVIEEVVKVKIKPKVFTDDEEYHWTKAHLHEQTFKVSKIKDIAQGHRKLILVCHYTAQIDFLKEKLEKLRPVYVLDGRTKDSSNLIKEAQQSPDCFFIVQSSMGMGFDGYMFGALVFVSMGHRVLDAVQMKGRLTSVDNPKPCLYYYITASGDSWDKKIYNSVIKEGVDFDIHKYE